MCHQTVGLIARHLEEAGIPTVVAGSARDIVEQCGVPRFLFVDYPLGNPMGRPYDEAEQAELFTLSLDLFERAFVPRTTVQAPVVWDEAETWRANFMKIDEDVRDQLVAEGEERRRKQAEAKETGKARQA